MTSRCPLRFDFAIIKDESIIGLIEYNGDQHYHVVDHFGGEEGYKMTVLRDEMKKEYCSKNHIPLLILNKNNNLKIDIETFIKYVKKEFKNCKGFILERNDLTFDKTE